MAAPEHQVRFGGDRDGLAGLFSLFVEQVDNFALVLIDPNGSILSWNNGAERLFGYLPSEVIGTSFARLYIPEDRQNGRPERELADARQTGLASDRNWLRRNDGTRFWANGETIALRTPSGTLRGFGKIVQDITVLKEAEDERARLAREVEEERAWLRAAVEQSPIGVILVEGAEGGHVVANARTAELFGRPLPPEGGIDQYVGQILLANGTPRPREDLAVTRALQGQLVRSEEELLRHPDGTEVRVLVSAVPVLTHGQMTGAVIVYEDITRLRQLERQREEWTAAVAHDLRQSVAIITGYSGLLLRLLGKQAPPREKAALTHVSEAAWNLNKMIGDLLEVARVESQHLSLQPVALVLPELVRDVIERMAAITEGHPVCLEVDEGIPAVQADPVRIEQVLGNLLSNAVKYGYPDTEIRVRIRRQNAAVAVSVTNEGAGIQAEEIPKVFSRFYRTATARAAKTSGLGLGLYISRGIVEAHGGQIWAESIPGTTTTFTFTLPVPRESA